MCAFALHAMKVHFHQRCSLDFGPRFFFFFFYDSARRCSIPCSYPRYLVLRMYRYIVEGGRPIAGHDEHVRRMLERAFLFVAGIRFRASGIRDSEWIFIGSNCLVPRALLCPRIYMDVINPTRFFFSAPTSDKNHSFISAIDRPRIIRDAIAGASSQ